MRALFGVHIIAGSLSLLFGFVALYAAKAFGKGHWRQYRRGMPRPTRRNIDAHRALEHRSDPAPKADADPG